MNNEHISTILALREHIAGLELEIAMRDTVNENLRAAIAHPQNAAPPTLAQAAGDARVAQQAGAKALIALRTKAANANAAADQLIAAAHAEEKKDAAPANETAAQRETRVAAEEAKRRQAAAPAPANETPAQREARLAQTHPVVPGRESSTPSAEETPAQRDARLSQANETPGQRSARLAAEERAAHPPTHPQP